MCSAPDIRTLLQAAGIGLLLTLVTGELDAQEVTGRIRGRLRDQAAAPGTSMSALPTTYGGADCPD